MMRWKLIGALILLSWACAAPALAQEDRDLMWEHVNASPDNPVLTKAEQAQAMALAAAAAPAVLKALDSPSADVRWIRMHGSGVPATAFAFCGSVRVMGDNGKKTGWRRFGLLVTQGQPAQLELSRTEDAFNHLCRAAARPAWTDPQDEFIRIFASASKPKG